MAYKWAYDEEKVEYKPPKLDDKRSIWKFIIFNALTLGFYSIFFFMPFSYDIDKVAPKRDGTKTMSFFIAYVLSIITFSIVMLVWHHHIAQRVEEALQERNIDYDFGTGAFWGWYILGSFIFVGPYIYISKLIEAMNLLCADYNERNNLS